MTDLTIEYSKLSIAADGTASAAVADGDRISASALLLRVIETEAEKLAAPQAVDLVTVSTDVTGPLKAGEVAFETRLDRRTRTLIFIGGEATQNGGPVLRMTTIYRIA
ncbi:MAG: acyl-CoA thioesterase domain-containing protein [Pseudomonadota bacterium]